MRYRNGLNVHGDDIEVYITMPAVSSVSLSGSGNLSIAGSFPEAESFRLSVSGSADTEVKDIFKCHYLTADISGSGNADLLQIQAKRAELTISGSGNVRVFAERKLHVRISGSGRVYYQGSPVVSSEISGSGRVQHL